jgi:hypothetical protein
MHSALFVLQLPLNESEWRNFADRAKLSKWQGKGASRLAENVWLLNFQESPEPLGLLIAAAAALGFSYGILPFEHAPQWLPVGFDPNTIMAGSNQGQR